jgi:hypothetical protein
MSAPILLPPVTDIFIFYGNGWQTDKHPANTDFYDYVQKEKSEH